MAYVLYLTNTANKALISLRKKDPALPQRIEKALGQLENDPTHPSLRSHPFQTLRGPKGELIWESTVSQDGAAWRIWWHFGPNERTSLGKLQAVITVIAIGKHP